MALGRTHIVAPLGASDDTRKLVNRVNVGLRALDRRKPIATPSVFRDNTSRPAAEGNRGRIIFVQNADGTVTGQYSDGAAWQTFLATSVSYAAPTVTYGTTYGAGTLSTTIRSDARLKFPTAIMSSANSSTLTLTDDATDQTLTGSLGTLNIRPTAETVSLPKWTGGGANSATVGRVLSFAALTSTIGTTLSHGVFGSLAYNTAATYTGVTHRGMEFQVLQTSTAPTYTNETVQVLRLQYDTGSMSTNTYTWTEIDGISNAMEVPLGANVTVTDAYGHRMLGWPTLGTGGTYTNVACERLMLPTVGATIRRGVWVDSSSTASLGTEAANVEAFYASDIPRGTAQRTGFYTEGATTGTPTDVYGFYQGTAHVVGTNRYGFRATGATTGTPTLCVGFYADGHAVGTTKWAFYGDGDASHFAGIDMKDATDMVVGSTTGTKIGTATTQKLGFWNKAPVVQPAAYTPTNVTTDRAYDANATTLDEVADVLGTLIADLQSVGLIG